MTSSFTQSATLSLMAQARPEEIKAFAEELVGAIEPVEVLASRTGLVMLPCRDTAHGTIFHLGEVLVGEAHIRLQNGIEGYGAVIGRDLEHAMAIAVLDAAATQGHAREAIDDYLHSELRRKQAEDENRLRKVEATRVEKEIF